MDVHHDYHLVMSSAPSVFEKVGGFDGCVLSFYNPFGDLRRQAAVLLVVVVAWTQSFLSRAQKEKRLCVQQGMSEAKHIYIYIFIYLFISLFIYI